PPGPPPRRPRSPRGAARARGPRTGSGASEQDFDSKPARLEGSGREMLLRLTRGKEAREHLEEQESIDGLGHVLVAADLEAALALAAHGMRGQGHDRAQVACLPQGR